MLTINQTAWWELRSKFWINISSLALQFASSFSLSFTELFAVCGGFYVCPWVGFDVDWLIWETYPCIMLRLKHTYLLIVTATFHIWYWWVMILSLLPSLSFSYFYVHCTIFYDNVCKPPLGPLFMFIISLQSVSWRHTNGLVVLVGI